jgi:hypothetical protein
MEKAVYLMPVCLKLITRVPVAFHISLVSDLASEGNRLKLTDKTLI